MLCWGEPSLLTDRTYVYAFIDSMQNHLELGGLHTKVESPWLTCHLLEAQTLLIQQDALPGATSAQGCRSSAGFRTKKNWRDCLDATTISLGRTTTFFGKIESDTYIDYDLPRKGSNAGQVLRHAKAVVQKVIESQRPCTYKIGWTHDPHFRFHNNVYGYKYDRNGWQAMLVIFISHEAVGPAFLEATLIQNYMGTLIGVHQHFRPYEYVYVNLFFWVYVYICVFFWNPI